MSEFPPNAMRAARIHAFGGPEVRCRDVDFREWRVVRATLTQDIAARFAGIALGHVTREFPNKLDHVLASADDVRAPSALHPVFHGSFDWHSCVHGYWLLARLLLCFPEADYAAEIVELFDARLTAEKVAGECNYLAAPLPADLGAPTAGAGY